MILTIYRGSAILERLEIVNGDVVEFEGVKFSAELLKSILSRPPEGKFSFLREGDNINVTREDN